MEKGSHVAALPPGINKHVMPREEGRRSRPRRGAQNWMTHTVEPFEWHLDDEDANLGPKTRGEGGGVFRL